MEKISHTKELIESFSISAKYAETAEQYADLAVQASNIASVCAYEAQILANINGCNHSRWHQSLSGWGGIECSICKKRGFFNSVTKKAEF